MDAGSVRNITNALAVSKLSACLEDLQRASWDERFQTVYFQEIKETILFD